MRLGGEGRWFIGQVWRDTEFLRRHGIVDYSLLVIPNPYPPPGSLQVGVQREFSPPPSAREASPTSRLEEAPTPAPSTKMDIQERRALWDSLVKLVEDGEGEGKDDTLLLERLRMGSRLSNISAIVELLGEQDSPARNGSAMSEESRTK